MDFFAVGIGFGTNFEIFGPDACMNALPVSYI